jgi:hypothetical protein
MYGVVFSKWFLLTEQVMNGSHERCEPALLKGDTNGFRRHLLPLPSVVVFFDELQAPLNSLLLMRQIAELLEMQQSMHASRRCEPVELHNESLHPALPSAAIFVARSTVSKAQRTRTEKEPAKWIYSLTFPKPPYGRCYPEQDALI